MLGLSILPRYLTVPAVALCVFAGYALAGFTALPADDPRRGRWMRASAAATVLGVVVLALLAPSLDRVSAELRFIRTTHDDLGRAARRPARAGGDALRAAHVPDLPAGAGRPLASSTRRASR